MQALKAPKNFSGFFQHALNDLNAFGSF